MYGLKYIAAFKDLDNSSYRVEISQDGYSGKVTELIAAGTPFTTSYKEEDFLYQPLRLSGGTLSVVGKDYLKDLYSEGPQRNKVNLYKENDLIWTGFILPESYTQNYSNNLFEFNIETVSALSTLEYIKFVYDKDMVSIHQLMADAIRRSNGDYKGLYIPAVYGDKAANVLKKMKILSSNFIDEDNDPMTYKEILEEICLFFSWTITDYNGDIFFIDIDYIKRGFSEYFFYDKDFKESLVILSTEKQNIQLQAFTGTGATLDILPGYNKINVVCSDYEADADALYPEIEVPDGLGMQEVKFEKSHKILKRIYKETAGFDLINYRLSGTKFYETQLELKGPLEGQPEPPFQKTAGAVLCKKVNIDEDNPPNRLDWENMIQIKLFYDRNYNYLIESDKLPVIKTTEKTRPFFFDQDYLMAVYFSVQFYDKNEGIPGTSATNKNDKIGKRTWPVFEDAKDWFVPVTLRVGNKYYDGRSDYDNSSNAGNGPWVNYPVIFNIYTDITKDTHFTFDWLNAKNDFDYTSGTENLKGKKISFEKLRPSGIFGDVELIIYCPQSTKFRDYDHRFVFMKNISVKVQKKTFGEKKKAKEDTLYEQTVNDVFIRQAEDIRLKITSKNDSELSYSKVIFDNAALDKIYNRLTESAMKPEELIIERVVNQYASSKIKTTQTLNPGIVPFRLVSDDFQKGKDFLVVGEDVNYKMLQSKITVIEVK